MNNNIKTNNYFPIEINLIKNIIFNETDPIIKEIYSFNEIASIMGNLTCFPINTNRYYLEQSNESNTYNTRLMLMLAQNYLKYKIKNIHQNTKKTICIQSEDFVCTNYLINNFYDYNKPIIDKRNNNILWIYPKISFKKYIACCIENNNYQQLYINDLTYIKLIIIMYLFVQYEYENADAIIIDKFIGLNYPTLILANIKLYEKGFLQLTEYNNSIIVKLNSSKNKTKTKRKCLTDNIDTLKRKILQVINILDSKNYTINDFLD